MTNISIGELNLMGKLKYFSAKQQEAINRMTTVNQSSIKLPLKTLPMKEIGKVICESLSREPTTQEETYKYANATLTNIIMNHTEEFNYVFMNDPNDFMKLAEWFNRKEKESFSEKEMLGLKVLNTSSIKYFGLVIFKDIAIGLFDEDQVYEDLGVPIHARGKFKRSKK